MSDITASIESLGVQVLRVRDDSQAFSSRLGARLADLEERVDLFKTGQSHNSQGQEQLLSTEMEAANTSTLSKSARVSSTLSVRSVMMPKSVAMSPSAGGARAPSPTTRTGTRTHSPTTRTGPFSAAVGTLATSAPLCAVGDANKGPPRGAKTVDLRFPGLATEPFLRSSQGQLPAPSMASCMAAVAAASAPLLPTATGTTVIHLSRPRSPSPLGLSSKGKLTSHPSSQTRPTSNHRCAGAIDNSARSKDQQRDSELQKARPMDAAEHASDTGVFPL